MNTMDAIAKRVSVRAYRPEQISDEALDAILRAGCAAPIASAKYDSMHITVVQSEDVLRQIMDETSDFVSRIFGTRREMDFGAKTLIIVSGKPGMSPGIEYANAGCMLENMLLAATDMGIDNIIWGAAAAVVAQSDSLKARLCIPEGFTPLLCASFGYAENETLTKKHTVSVTRI